MTKTLAERNERLCTLRALISANLHGAPITLECRNRRYRILSAGLLPQNLGTLAEAEAKLESYLEALQARVWAERSRSVVECIECGSTKVERRTRREVA